MRKIIYTIVCLGLIGGGIGFYLFNKPLESIKSMKTQFEVSSDDLLESFEDDEESANQKYLDKVIQVTGVVSKTETENDKMSIYLNTSNDLSNIIFQLEKEDASIKKGQEVTLKGICTGYLMDVVLVRSVKV